MSIGWFIPICFVLFCFFFFKQKTAYEMRISDWSSDVCSSDLGKTRNECLMRLRRALEEYVIEGVKTTIPLHMKIISDADFVNGAYDKIGRASCRERVCQYV